MACADPGLAALGAALTPDLRKRIDIMAEHIARNGPEFEMTVKQKNENNPQFSFLFGYGEGAEYFAQVLAANRGSAVPGGVAGSHVGSSCYGGSAPSQPATVQGQGLSPDVSALLRKWQEPTVYPLQPEVERQMMEVLSSLEQMASIDAIRNGRQWVESNVVLSQQIAGNITKMMSHLPSSTHRLHILYLVHDVLQTEAARKEPTRPLIRAFKPYLVWMLRPAYQHSMAMGQSDDGGKTLRLLQLWVERSIITGDEAEEIKKLILAPNLPLPQSAQQFRPPTPKPNGMNFGGATIMGAGGRSLPGMNGAAIPPNRAILGMQPTGMRPSMGLAMQPRPTMAPGGCRPMYGGMMHGQHANGYSLYRQKPGPQTPETIPVGVMATMLIQVRKQKRSARDEFVPYLPLEVGRTPQALPVMEPTTQRLLEKVQDFYQDLRDDERSSSSSSSSRSSRSRSRSPAGFDGATAKAAPASAPAALEQQSQQAADAAAAAAAADAAMAAVQSWPSMGLSAMLSHNFSAPAVD